MSKIATRKIHNFDFKKAKHHVALVDKAANLTEVMVMKADNEVTVSTSMRSFLEKFYGMWTEDAASLAGILGYSDGKFRINTGDDLALDYGGVYDNFPKYVNEDGSNPMMYKSATEFMAGEFSSLEILKGAELPDKLPYSVTEKIKAVEKAYEILLKTSEESSDEDNITIEKGDSKLELTQEQLDKQAADLKTALEQIETMKAQTSEVETLKGLVAEMKADKVKQATANMVEVVKGFTFVSAEAQTGLVEALMKVEDNTEILKALESGREAVAAAINLDDEQGAEGGEDNTSTTDVEKGHDATIAHLKARKKGNV